MWSWVRRHTKTVELPQSDGSNRIVWKKLSISDFARQMETELADRRAAILAGERRENRHGLRFNRPLKRI